MDRDEIPNFLEFILQCWKVNQKWTAVDWALKALPWLASIYLLFDMGCFETQLINAQFRLSRTVVRCGIALWTLAAQGLSCSCGTL
jgi:hypothetical protein